MIDAMRAGAMRAGASRAAACRSSEKREDPARKADEPGLCLSLSAYGRPNAANATIVTPAPLSGGELIYHVKTATVKSRIVRFDDFWYGLASNLV